MIMLASSDTVIMTIVLASPSGDVTVSCSARNGSSSPEAVIDSCPCHLDRRRRWPLGIVFVVGVLGDSFQDKTRFFLDGVAQPSRWLWR